jgi:hypothetical protein
MANNPDQGQEGYDDYEDRPRTRRNIPTYLAQAILCTLFCCLPFGIVAIVFAAQVGSKLSAGDISGAQRSSDQARMWCWISFGVGIVAVPIVVFIQIMAQQQLGRMR